jgi:hypothetical protein
MEALRAGRAARRRTGRLDIRAAVRGRLITRHVRVTARRRVRIIARRDKVRRLLVRRVAEGRTRPAADRTVVARLIAAVAGTRAVADIPAAVAGIRIARFRRGW